MKLEIQPRASPCILTQCRNAILLALAKNYPVSGQMLGDRMPNYLRHPVFHWRTVSVSEKCHSSLSFSCTVMSDSATPWTATHQSSQSFTISRSLLKLMSIESVMPSNHLILCRPVLFLPSIFCSIGSFLMSQFFASGSQINGASASVLPVNIQGWFTLELTGLISLQCHY